MRLHELCHALVPFSWCGKQHFFECYFDSSFIAQSNSVMMREATLEERTIVRPTMENAQEIFQGKGAELYKDRIKNFLKLRRPKKGGIMKNKVLGIFLLSVGTVVASDLRESENVAGACECAQVDEGKPDAFFSMRVARLSDLQVFQSLIVAYSFASPAAGDQEEISASVIADTGKFYGFMAPLEQFSHAALVLFVKTGAAGVVRTFDVQSIEQSPLIMREASLSEKRHIAAKMQEGEGAFKGNVAKTHRAVIRTALGFPIKK